MGGVGPRRTEEDHFTPGVRLSVRGTSYRSRILALFALSQDSQIKSGLHTSQYLPWRYSSRNLPPPKPAHANAHTREGTPPPPRRNRTEVFDWTVWRSRPTSRIPPGFALYIFDSNTPSRWVRGYTKVPTPTQHRKAKQEVGTPAG